jgi:hypothetical protein
VFLFWASIHNKKAERREGTGRNAVKNKLKFSYRLSASPAKKNAFLKRSALQKIFSP